MAIAEPSLRLVEKLSMPLELAIRICDARSSLNRAGRAGVQQPRKRDEEHLRPDGTKTVHINTIEGLRNFMRKGVR